MFRLLLPVGFVLLAQVLHAASLPAELTAALAEFRSEGPRGWGFVQKSEAGAESRVERFDPLRPEFQRWTLLQQNGREPTPDERRVYSEGKTRRTAGLSAPRIQEQMDLESAEHLSADDEREQWRFRLKPSAADDRAARYMSLTLTFHRPTRTIEQVEIASREPFSPVLGVKIAETRTLMTYSLPTPEQPSLLLRVTLHVRGRAFWIKSLDEDMTITYSDHVWAGKKPAPR